MCAVATGPNTIPVSPEWKKRLLGTRSNANDETDNLEKDQPIKEQQGKIAPEAARGEEKGLSARDSSEKGVEMTGGEYTPKGGADGPSWWGEDCADTGFNDVGILCCVETTAALQVESARKECEALLDTGASSSFINSKTAERLGLKGYELLAQQVAGMKAEEAAVLLRPPPKGYKAHARAGAKVPVDSIVQQAKVELQSLGEPVRGLCYIMALPKAGGVGAHRLRDERQRALYLEAGFHQIRMTTEDRWKTAFRSVMGLFEYRVMPIGLKDDVLVYSPDSSKYAERLQQVLSFSLKYQFYPKLSKCKFAKRKLTYLGYTIGAEGIKPAADKVEAVRLWPEQLSYETQVRQILGTVNYCRMLMGSEYAEVARPLADLTRKDAVFMWTGIHTQAVRQLKQRLIEYTTLQVPDTKKLFNLYTDT
ncbi:OSJNBa0042F21.10 protein, related [Eimeria praecox]|uniref:OSJNBa0042F21.10 protein, related n=1 Tax=Eimeria praecox TaxID=51316 RepID=U6H5G0_9EIME|nr:OSJNBa0042F21.10 protein, related [Eimeria praecox]